MRTFKELQDMVERRLNDADPGTDWESEIKMSINMIQEQCNKHRSLRKVLLKKGRILVKAEVTTGTVAVTNGSKTVTFSSAILNADFKGRVFVSDDDPDVEYRLASITSTTIGKLDAFYGGDDNTVSTFKILKDRYYLDRDVFGVHRGTMWDRTNEQRIWLQNKTGLSDGDVFNVDTDAEPENGAIILSTDTFYSTGTVAITTATKDIVITTGTFIEEMDGMAIRLDGDSVDYTFTYVDANNGTIDRNYEGTTATSDTFKMAPPGQWMVELYERPTEQILLDFDFLFRLPRLVGDNDISIITTLDDNVLWRGAIWAMKDIEDVEIQDANNAEAKYLRAQDSMALSVGLLQPEVSKTKYRDL